MLVGNRTAAGIESLTTVRTHLSAMVVATTEASELLTAELTDDVLHFFLLHVLSLSDEPVSHGVDLVLEQMLPVLAVDVASLAVVVAGFSDLMILRLLLGVEGKEAVMVGALVRLERIEWSDHGDGQL